MPYHAFPSFHFPWVVTRLCETDNICIIFLTFNMNDGILCRILSVPHNIVMDLNNVMNASSSRNMFCHTRNQEQERPRKEQHKGINMRISNHGQHQD